MLLEPNRDTVKSSEKVREHSEEAKLIPKSSKIPPIRTQVTREVVKNFTCPACGELLEEVVAINGFIQGECGINHKPIKVSIPK